MFQYEIQNLSEDLEKKLLLYSNSNDVENYGQYFNEERYERFVNIIINKYSANIDDMINQLVRYYKNGIEFKDDKLSFDYSEVRMIGSKLYKELFYIDSQTVFSKYLKIVETKLHGDIEWWFYIYFDDDNIKNNFLDSATQYIIDYQNKKWKSELKKINYTRYSWLQYISEEDIPEKFENFTKLYFWLKKHDAIEHLMFLGTPLVNTLVNAVITLDNFNIHTWNENRILMLLKKCQNDYIIVGKILTSNNIKLNIFLLQQFDYSLIAFLNLFSIDSEPHNLVTKEINYTQQWQEMITNELINIYFKHFYNHNKEQFSEILFRLINSLVGIYFQNTNDFKIENTLFGVFTKISKFQRKLYNGKEYLFDIVIDELIEKQLSILNVDDTFNIENLFILSYYIEHLNAKQKIFERDYSILINKITKGILSYVQSVLSNDNLYIKDLDDLEKIDFGLVYVLSENQDIWLKIIDIDATAIKWQSIIDEEKTKKVLSSNDPKKPKEIIEIYFQMLLIIFKHKQEDQIAQILNRLAINFGLNVEFGIFEDSPWKYNRLYEMYVESLNLFDENLFDELIENLQQKYKLKDMLKLLSHTVVKSRQEKIKSKIELLSKGASEDTISYFEMRESIQYAMYNGFDELAEKLIAIYKDKIKTTGYKHKEKEFYEIVYRKKLLDILYSDVSFDDKFDTLREYEIPFDDKNFGEQSKQVKCENYRTFIRALLFFETEPRKTYEILEHLLEKEINSQYLINMLSAYFKTYENDEDKVEKFHYILNEFESYQQKLRPYNKSLHEYSTLLYGYAVAKDENKINQLWKEMPLSYHYDINIFEIRCEFLQDINQSLTAKEYIIEFKQFHQNITSDEFEIVNEIEKKLDENITIEIEDQLQIVIGRQRLLMSLKEAKTSWLEIKEMSSEEHAQIFSNKENLNVFIVDIVLQIAKELLNRKINLTREKERGLELEDIINDWVTSLLNQKMSFLHWSARDQTRGGSSSSGQNVGEKDLEVYSSKGEKLFLFEAFRLFGNDSTAISEHINKLNGYNTDGCRTMVVMVYSSVNNFVSLCSNYQNLLKTFVYKGFDKLESLETHSFEEIDSNSSNIKIIKEIRQKNNIPINIYHYLLDFKD